MMNVRAGLKYYFLFGLAVYLVYPVAISGGVNTQNGKTFIFDRLNRSYQDISPDPAEVRQGPLTIFVSSPRHVVVLRKHSLEVWPDQKGTFRAVLNAEFEGGGDLTADLDLMGLNGSMDDQFKIPLQKKRIQGKFRVSRVEGGYRVIPVAQPKEVEVEIQTGMGTRVLGWCLRMEQVPLSPFKCGGLDRSLSRLKIPLSQDQFYFIHDRDLTMKEREEINLFLIKSERSKG